MIYGKYRDTGITQCFKFWFDGAIAENTNYRVHLA